MSSKRERRTVTIRDLLQICYNRGITNEALKDHVRGVYTYFSKPATESYDDDISAADEVSSGGLAAQLDCLKEAHGDKTLVSILMKMGGVLDALSNLTSSSQEDLERNYSVNEDGDVKFK